MKYLILFCSCCFLYSCSLNNKKAEKYEGKLTVAFYNVENLFDTVDDDQKNDNEFLPESEKQWNKERYEKKLDSLAKAIASINIENLPALIGFCEIENRQVLQDLNNRTALQKVDYEIIHEETTDPRGIDQAIFFNPKYLTYINHRTLEVDAPDSPGRKMRHILYLKTLAINSDTLHFFVNHWSSRRGGELESEKKRIASAKVLKYYADSLLLQNPESKIIILGDMNDEPNNVSLYDTLGAKKNLKEAKTTKLVNLMYQYVDTDFGTYNFRGEWNVLDNVIVSEALLVGKGFTVINEKAHIHAPDFLIHKNQKNGEISPSKTYGGNKYFGGFSDHFPVFFEISEK